MYKNKKSGVLGSIITLIILIVLVFTTNLGANNFSGIEKVVNKLVMPIQNAFTLFKNKIKNNNISLENFDALQKENEELKKQNIELEKKVDELEILKSENNILKEYANLGEKYSEYDYVTSYIINKNIGNFSEVFVINAGTNDGIYENMPVMGKDGLVGHTISATKTTAKVQPIIDSTSNISAITTNNRDNVIVKGKTGSNKELIVTCIQPDTEFMEGDTIETSGLGGIYPKGIKIGTIKEIVETKNSAEKYAIMESNVDFEKLEYVLVIKK